MPTFHGVYITTNCNAIKWQIWAAYIFATTTECLHLKCLLSFQKSSEFADIFWSKGDFYPHTPHFGNWHKLKILRPTYNLSHIQFFSSSPPNCNVRLPELLKLDLETINKIKYIFSFSLCPALQRHSWPIDGLVLLSTGVRVQNYHALIPLKMEQLEAWLAAGSQILFRTNFNNNSFRAFNFVPS